MFLICDFHKKFKRIFWSINTLKYLFAKMFDIIVIVIITVELPDKNLAGFPFPLLFPPSRLYRLPKKHHCRNGADILVK